MNEEDEEMEKEKMLKLDSDDILRLMKGIDLTIKRWQRFKWGVPFSKMLRRQNCHLCVAVDEVNAHHGMWGHSCVACPWALFVGGGDMCDYDIRIIRSAENEKDFYDARDTVIGALLHLYDVYKVKHAYRKREEDN